MTQRFSRCSCFPRRAVRFALATAALPLAALSARAEGVTPIPATSLIAAQPAPAFSLFSAQIDASLQPGQSRALEYSSSSLTEEASAALPEAPSAVLQGVPLQAGVPASGGRARLTGPVASIHTKYIPAGWQAQPLDARDKVILGFRDLVSPLDLIAVVVSAGYSHVTNGQPNFGVDEPAFGQRVGAAAAREASQGLFTDAVFAPLLREDPRYYVEGSQYGFFHRTIYSITRPLITKTDSGRTTVNAALLLGYAGAAALSYTYYPSVNQNFHDTASTFGGSIGGAALGFFVSEFADSTLVALHLKKQ